MAHYDVDPARALPTSAYRPESFDVDLERIWRGDWIFVGTSDEVATPGDYVVTDLGGQSVIVLRTQEGELSALSNLCAHRGTLLAEGHGNAKRFQCPYHAWTYADDGRLLGVPHAARVDVDRQTHCLPTYRAEEWHGLVFASMNNDVASVADRLSHLEPIVADAGQAELHHWTEARTEEIWDANWKLVIANAMESYHLFSVHETTLEPYAPTAGAYYLVGDAHGTATGGTSPTGENEYTLLSVPPNFVGTLSGGALYWQAVQPLAWNKTRVVTGTAFDRPPPSESKGLAKLAGKLAGSFGSMLPDFLPEDRAICERGQASASGAFAPGVLVPMEHVISDFHQYLAHRIHGTPIPPVRSSPEVGIAPPTVETAT